MCTKKEWPYCLRPLVSIKRLGTRLSGHRASIVERSAQKRRAFREAYSGSNPILPPLLSMLQLSVQWRTVLALLERCYRTIDRYDKEQTSPLALLEARWLAPAPAQQLLGVRGVASAIIGTGSKFMLLPSAHAHGTNEHFVCA